VIEDGHGPTHPDTIALAARQWREALGDATRVTCECGLAAPLRFLFRCLYCGCFFCQSCAEVHFGKTRAQYRAEQAAGG
jgi:hypothetical protein